MTHPDFDMNNDREVDTRGSWFHGCFFVLTLAGISGGIYLASHSEKDETVSVVASPLELKLEDEDRDGRLELPSSLDRHRSYTLSFDENGRAYLK